MIINNICHIRRKSPMKKYLSISIVVFAAAVLLSSCGKSDEVKNVQQLISDVGNSVGLDSEEAINTAKEAYDNLPDEEKDKVGNYKKLEAAIEKFENLSDMNSYIANVIDAAETDFSNSDFGISEYIDRYDEMVEAYNGLSREDKEKIQDFDKLEESVAKLKEYNESATGPAAAYVRGFLEVNKGKDYTVTKVGCIKQIREDKEYHFFALTYKDKAGKEHNVYSTARYADANVLGTIIARPDIFFADKPASEDTDCLKNGNVDIDLDEVLKAAEALSADVVVTTEAEKTTETEKTTAA